MAKYPVIGANPGEVEVPDSSGGGGGAGSSYQWAWTMVYVDPPHYTRNQSGKGRGINIATGKYPAGYKVPNGQKGGGYPSGQSDGTKPIRMVAPIRGTGRCTFVTHFKVLITNKESSIRKYCIGLGVSEVTGSGQPMFPFLGVGHDLGVWEGQMSFETINPGESRLCTGFRVDIVDNDFAAVPNWPNWELSTNADTLMYPAVTPLMTVESGNLAVGDVFLVGYVY